MKNGKRFKSISAIILILVFCFTLIGCGNKNTTSSNSTPNKNSNQQEIVDMAGRKVTIPKNIKKLYSTSPIGSIMIYTINADKLSGWNYKLSPIEKKYILKKYQNLPMLGGWFGKGNTGNIEEIMKAKPDVIVNMGTITKKDISNSDAIQKQTGLPVVMVNGDLDKFDQAYNFLGNLMNEKDRTSVLAKYCTDTINKAKDNAKNVPESKRIRVYYAEGPKGLQTDPSGSQHAELLDLVGGYNVAKVKDTNRAGQEDVSLEQVLSWNPDVIITGSNSGGAGASILNIISKDSSWKNIKAVNNKKVYEIPQGPFNWFDRPPSVNRMIGVKWIGNLLYPDNFKYDMEKETKEFYKLFYHYNLTDSETKELLKNAGGK